MNANKVAALNACGKYLPVTVLRPANFPDCTNGGVTSYTARLFIPCPDGYMLEAECDPGAILELLPPAFEGCGIRVKPRSIKRHSMAGGNFVYSSDSRFSSLYGGPLSVHDRVE